MVGRRKLPNPSLNRIFNALSIGVQYTLSFQLTNFGMKCLVLLQKTRFKIKISFYFEYVGFKTKILLCFKNLVSFQKSYFVLKNLKVQKLKSRFIKKHLSYLFKNLKAISLKSNAHETRKWQLKKSIDFAARVESYTMKMIVFV